MTQVFKIIPGLSGVPFRPGSAHNISYIRILSKRVKFYIKKKNFNNKDAGIWRTPPPVGEPLIFQRAFSKICFWVGSKAQVFFETWMSFSKFIHFLQKFGT